MSRTAKPFCQSHGVSTAFHTVLISPCPSLQPTRLMSLHVASASARFAKKRDGEARMGPAQVWYRVVLA